MSARLRSKRNTKNRFYLKSKVTCYITMFFIFKKVKETMLEFSQGTARVFWIYFALIHYQYKSDSKQHSTLSYFQHNELKLAIKNGTKKTLKFSSKMIGDFNDESKFLHKLLLTERQVFKLRKAFTNNLSANIIIKL